MLLRSWRRSRLRRKPLPASRHVPSAGATRRGARRGRANGAKLAFWRSPEILVRWSADETACEDAVRLTVARPFRVYLERSLGAATSAWAAVDRRRSNDAGGPCVGTASTNPSGVPRRCLR